MKNVACRPSAARGGGRAGPVVSRRSVHDSPPSASGGFQVITARSKPSTASASPSTDGEALAVIGPNGAGKTTLFNLITGDAAASTGQIEFDGSDMTRMPPHARSRLGIGRSYQIPHPFANMSVFENLLVGAIYGGGISERESYKRCSDVLESHRPLRQGEHAGAHAHAVAAQATGTGARSRDPAEASAARRDRRGLDRVSSAANWSRPSRRFMRAAPPSSGSSISSMRWFRWRAG